MEPIVKWVGGKRQLLARIKERMPKEYKNYFEPFIGGGAVFFGIDLTDKKATINDKNRELISLYNVVKDNNKELIEKLNELQDTYNNFSNDEERAAFYYEIRSKFNDGIINNKVNDIEQSAYFIFLNKHGFNGLYRLNAQGLLNVPTNKRKTSKLYNKDNIEEVAKRLKKTTILNGDFEDAVKKARKGDFVFFDSPYAPLNPTSFEKNTIKRFDYVVETENQIYCFETNFYTGGGSKLNETARSFKMIAEEMIFINGITFIWVTDGKEGWTSARNNLKETFDVMEHIYNIKDLEDGILHKILK